jgi:hypothetical protein
LTVFQYILRLEVPSSTWLNLACPARRRAARVAVHQPGSAGLSSDALHWSVLGLAFL